MSVNNETLLSINEKYYKAAEAEILRVMNECHADSVYVGGNLVFVGKGEVAFFQKEGNTVSAITSDNERCAIRDIHPKDLNQLIMSIF